MPEQILSLKAVTAPATLPRGRYPTEISDLPKYLAVENPQQVSGVSCTPGLNPDMEPTVDQTRAPWVKKGTWDGTDFNDADVKGFLNGQWRSLMPDYTALIAAAATVSTAKDAAVASANVATSELNTAQNGQPAYIDRGTAATRNVYNIAQDKCNFVYALKLINYDGFKRGRESKQLTFPDKSGNYRTEIWHVFFPPPGRYSTPPFVMIEIEGDNNIWPFWWIIEKITTGGFFIKFIEYMGPGGVSPHHDMSISWMAFGTLA